MTARCAWRLEIWIPSPAHTEEPSRNLARARLKIFLLNFLPRIQRDIGKVLAELLLSVRSWHPPRIQRNPSKPLPELYTYTVSARIQRMHPKIPEPECRKNLPCIQRNAQKLSPSSYEAWATKCPASTNLSASRVFWKIQNTRNRNRNRKQHRKNFSTTPLPNICVPSHTDEVLFLGFFTTRGISCWRTRNITFLTGKNHLRGVTKKVWIGT